MGMLRKTKGIKTKNYDKKRKADLELKAKFEAIEALKVGVTPRGIPVTSGGIGIFFNLLPRW